MPATAALHRGLLGSALAALTLGACSSAGHGARAGSSADPVVTRGGHQVARADPLAAALITDVPAGFTQAPERASHTGPTDLDQAISLDGHPDAKAALSSEGFQTGYQRLWTNGSGELIAVQVYRFTTAAGARADFARADRLADAQARHVLRYPVGDHPADELRGAEVDVEGNLTEQVIGVSGRDVMQVLCTSTTKPDLRGRVTALAASQFDRITTQK